MSAVHLFEPAIIDRPSPPPYNKNIAITILISSLLAIIAGVFLTLAACRILPMHANIVSQIGPGAWSIGAVFIITGSGGASIVLAKSGSRNRWLDANVEGYLYMQFLATQFPDFYLPERGIFREKGLLHPDGQTPHRISQIEKYIFDLLPTDPLYRQANSLAIALDVSGTHLTLIYIDQQKQIVEYYDSKQNYGVEYKTIIKMLKRIATKLSYKFIEKIQKELQPDSYNCVVWSLYFLENRLRYPKIDFNTLDTHKMQPIIGQFRKHIQKTIENAENLYKAAHQKAASAYLTFYKTPRIAYEKLKEDRLKIGYRAWRKLALSGKHLNPTQKTINY